MILGIGILVAIWVVANQPKSRSRSLRPDRHEFIRFGVLRPRKPVWRGEVDEVHSIDEPDYLRKMARHNDDPQSWPVPLPPPSKKVEFDMGM